MKRLPRTLLNWFGAIAVSILVLLTLFGWMINTESGARLVVSALVKIAPVSLRIEGVRGSLLGGLRIERVVLDDAKRRIAIDNVGVTWIPQELLHARLRITSLQVERLSVINKFERNPTPITLPETIALPFGLQIDKVSIAGGEIGWDVVNLIQLGSTEFNLQFDGQQYRLQLDRIDTRSKSGNDTLNSSVKGTVTLGVSKPYPLHVVFDSSSTARVKDNNIAATGKILVDGSLEKFSADINIEANQGSASGRVVLTPFAKQVLASANIDAQGIDLSAWGAQLPITQLDGRLTTGGDGIGQLTLSNRKAGLYSEGKVPVMNIRLGFKKTDEALIVDNFFAQLGSAKQLAGKMEGSAQYRNGAITLNIGIDALDLHRLDQRLLSTQLAGTIIAQHTAGKQQLKIDVREPVGKQNAALTANASLADLRLVLQKAELRIGKGLVSTAGYIDLLGAQNFHAEGDIQHFQLQELGKFSHLPALDLNGKFKLQGARQPRLMGDLSFQIKDSAIAGRGLQGEGQVQLRADRITVPKLLLVAGDNRLDLHGELSPENGQLSFTLSAPKLAQLGEGFGGELQVSGNVKGRFKDPNVTISWRGEKLKLQDLLQADNFQGDAAFAIHRDTSDWLGTVNLDTVKLDMFKFNASGRNLKTATQQLASLDAHIQFSPQSNSPLIASLIAEDVRLQGGSANKFSIDKISLNAKGTTAQHTLDATLVEAGKAQQLALQASGGLQHKSSASIWNGWAWNGMLTRFEATGKMSAQLVAPALLNWSAEQIKLNRFRIKSNASFVDIEEILRDVNGLHTSGSMENVSMAQILSFVRPNTLLTTDLQLNGNWDVKIAEDITGRVEIKRHSGDIVMKGGSTPIALGLRTVEASASASNGQLLVKLEADGQQLGKVAMQGKLMMDAHNRFGLSADTPIFGDAKIDVPSLGWLGAALSANVVTEGRLQGSVALSGSLNHPNLKGKIAATDLRIFHIDSGLDMRQGVLDSEFDGDVLRLQNLHFQSKNGSVAASGTLQLSEKNPSADIAIKADHFALLDRSDRQLTLSGTSRMAWSGQRANVTGVFDVNSGLFDIGRADMPQLSDDVIIVGREKQAGVPMLVSLDVKINLADGVRLKGKGLDALLQGQLQLISEEKQTLKALGTVRVAQGTYTAYGRKLAIERGTLRFNGPLFNPAIDIAAMRRGQDVEAGVALFGTVLAPRINLVSEPSVSEAEKLSWLVLGRPLDNASNTDLGSLQGAAGALLSQGAVSAVQSQIATAFGLDDFRIATSQDNVQQRIITLGKRLSSRLYVSYEQSLQAASSVLLLRYTLSPRLTVEAEAGTRSAMSLLYTVVFD